MATEPSAALTDPIKKVLEALEAEETLIASCAQQWRSLSERFASLSQTIADHSKALDANLESLESETQQSLDSLSHRESSIPDRETAAAALVETRRAFAVSEMEDPDFKPPQDLHAFLRLHCRRMDSANLWRFLASRCKGINSIRKKVADAVADSVDPVRLVLDAVGDFGETAAAPDDTGRGERCWAMGMLLQALFAEEGRKPPEVSGSIRERAGKVAEELKVKFEGKGGVMGPPETQMFLQLVVAFGLSSRFEEEFLRKMVLAYVSKKEMAKLAAGLGFGEKMADIIDEMVNSSKEIEAVYFAYESGLTERFPPIPLIKTYLHRSRKDATTIRKNGNHSIAANEESATVELGAIRSVIKCVETFNLQQNFGLDDLKKRLSQLEKAKADTKRNGSSNKFQQKRMRVGSPTFRSAKAVRTSKTPYASHHRNPITRNQMPASHHLYNYQAKAGFDGSNSSFGAAHGPSINSFPQQYYMPEDVAGPRGGMPFMAPGQPSYPRQL